MPAIRTDHPLQAQILTASNWHPSVRSSGAEADTDTDSSNLVSDSRTSSKDLPRAGRRGMNEETESNGNDPGRTAEADRAVRARAGPAPGSARQGAERRAPVAPGREEMERPRG